MSNNENISQNTSLIDVIFYSLCDENNPDVARYDRNMARKFGLKCAILYEEFKKTIFMKEWFCRNNVTIKKLIKLGFIECYYLNDDEIIEILKNKKPQIIDRCHLKCEWCLGTTFILHNHHYPIRKSKGGKDTVNICASCHCEFHYLSQKKLFKTNDEIVLKAIYE